MSEPLELQISHWLLQGSRAALFSSIGGRYWVPPDTLRLRAVSADCGIIRQSMVWESTIHTKYVAGDMNAAGDIVFVALEKKIHPDSTRRFREEFVSHVIVVVQPDGTTVQRELNRPGSRCVTAISPDGRWIAFFEWRDGTSEIHIINSRDLEIQASVNIGSLTHGNVVRSVDGLAISDRQDVVAGIRFDDPPGKLELYYFREGGSGGEKMPIPDESFCFTYRLRFFAGQYLHVVSEQFQDGTHYETRVFRVR